MGRAPDAVYRAQASLVDQMTRVVEPLLKIQGLAEADIESYDLDQLHDALDRLNAWLPHGGLTMTMRRAQRCGSKFRGPTRSGGAAP
jgi:hypothetical protein